MKLKSLAKVAAVSAVALGAVLNGVSGNAADEIGKDYTVNFTADVDNDATVTVTDGTLTFSALGHATDIAKATLDPDGTPHSDTGTGAGQDSAEPASLVFDPGTPSTAAKVEVAGTSFGTSELYLGLVDASAVTDLTCTGTGVIRIRSLTTDQATPFAYDNPSGGPAVTAPGHGPMAAGAATINIGVTLETSAGGVYQTGACTGGSFHIVLSY